jgi:hypothetical protein
MHHTNTDPSTPGLPYLGLLLSVIAFAQNHATAFQTTIGTIAAVGSICVGIASIGQMALGWAKFHDARRRHKAKAKEAS